MDIQKKQIFEFLKKLNLGLKNKKKYIIADKFKNCDLLLIYLFEMRLIKNYKIKDEALTFQLELAYDNNGHSVIKGLRHVQQKHYKETVKLKKLQWLISRKIPLYLFFETRQGILPLENCIKNRIGGNLWFWIY